MDDAEQMMDIVNRVRIPREQFTMVLKVLVNMIIQMDNPEAVLHDCIGILTDNVRRLTAPDM